MLDGVVRTVPQAEGLAQVLADAWHARSTQCSASSIDDDEIVRRLSGRTVCEKCQTPYTGREPGSACDKCGGTLMRRKDDEPEAIRNRLRVYERQTAPVLAVVQAITATKVAVIDAVGSSRTSAHVRSASLHRT